MIGIGVVGALLTDVKLDPGTDKYTIASTTAPQLVLWIVSVIATAYIVQIMTASETYFRDNYVPVAKLATPACQYAINNQTRTDSPAHKRYEVVELGTYHSSNKWTYNEGMIFAMYLLVVLKPLEFVCRGIEFANETGYLRWIESKAMGVSVYKIAGCLFQKVGDILITLFAFSLVLANDLAACPSYNSDNPTIEKLYISIVTFFGLTTLSIFVAMSGLEDIGVIYTELHRIKTLGYKSASSSDDVPM